MWNASSHYASFPKLSCIFLHIFLYNLYNCLVFLLPKILSIFSTFVIQLY